MDRDRSPIGLHRMRLVLLDDHDEAREALVRRAQRHPRLDVVGATPDPRTALDLIRAERPQAALIDTKRRDGRGAEALALLCGLEAVVRPLIVVYVTFLAREDEAAARRLGADAVLLKQLSTDLLADQLNALTRVSCDRR